MTLGYDMSKQTLKEPIITDISDETTCAYNYSCPDPPNDSFVYIFTNSNSDPADGNRCYGTNTQIDNYELSFSDAKINGIQLKLKKLYLVNGIYYLNLAFHSRDGFTYDYLHRMLSINIYSDKMDIGIFKPEHKWLDYFVEEN